MGDKKTKLTSVKVPDKLFEDFQITSVKSRFTFTKLVERAMYLYMMDEDFKGKIHDQLDINYTGSL